MKKEIRSWNRENTEEPQGIPHLQSCIREVFMTGIMSDWVMSTIEGNLQPQGKQAQLVHG